MAMLSLERDPFYQAKGVPLGNITYLKFVHILEQSILTFESTQQELIQIQNSLGCCQMNQLQNLLHDALISTEHVSQCAIIRRKDCSLRAASVGFNLLNDQMQMLIDAFKNPPQTREEGIYFEDKPYKCVRADKNSIYSKNGQRGLILVRTATLLLIATYTEQMYPSVCVEAVEKLAEYFKEKGK